MTNLRWPFFPLLFALAGCSNPTNPTVDHKSPISAASDSTLTLPERSDCIRGQAIPIISRTLFPAATFRLDADSITGYEVVPLESSDTLYITNSGCEYIVLDFDFHTSRFKDDTSDKKAWAANSVSLLKKIGPALKDYIGIKNGIRVLDSMVANMYSDGIYEHEIDYVPGEIRSFFELDKVEQTEPGRFSIKISFNYGPL